MTDYISRDLRKKPTQRGRYLILIVVLGMMLASATFYGFYHSPYLMRWLAEHKNYLQKDVKKGLVKVKQLAVHAKEPEPTIHFEFYNELPHMRVKVAESINTTKPAMSAAATSPIVSPADIEQELSNQSDRHATGRMKMRKRK